MVASFALPVKYTGPSGILETSLEVFTVTVGPVALQWVQFHKGCIVNDIL